MPGAPGEVPPQDKVGNSTFFLLLPGEHRVHAASNVCVGAQEGIKEQGHRALASAFKAFRKVLQILKTGHRSWDPQRIAESHSEAERNCLYRVHYTGYFGGLSLWSLWEPKGTSECS